MIYLILTIMFVLFQAFFSGIETGMVSLQRPRVRNGVKQKLKRAVILEFFLERPDSMLATILVGSNICVVCASYLGSMTAAEFDYDTPTGLFAVWLILLLAFLAAEIIPKNWFRQDPYGRCMLFSYLLYSSYIILFIPARLIALFTGKISGLLSQKNSKPDSAILLREDFRLLIRDSEEAGIIDSEVADILDNSIDFHNLTAADIMTPENKVISIPAGLTVSEALVFCRENSASRMPVYIDEEEKTWIGTFSIYDAIFGISEEEWKYTKVLSFLKPLCRIPASYSVSNVLVTTKKSHCPLLVVTDNSDSNMQIGIVTPTDATKNIFT